MLPRIPSLLFLSSFPLSLPIAVHAALDASGLFLCPLSLLLPFHDDRHANVLDYASGRNDSILSPELVRTDGINLLATVLMAMEDFTNRKSTVVDGLSKYTQCPIVFPSTHLHLVDTRRNPDNVIAQQARWFVRNYTCGVIGPLDNHVAHAVGSILEGTNVPAISQATASILASGAYTNVVLGMVAWDDIAIKVVKYVEALNRTSTAVLYTPGDNLDWNHDEYVKPWEDARKQTNFKLLLSVVYEESFRDDLKARLETIQGSVTQTVVVGFLNIASTGVLAEVADEMGMLDQNYLWILLDSAYPHRYVRAFELSSPSSEPLSKLLCKSRIFGIQDGFATSDSSASNNEEDFTTEWQNRSVGLTDQINAILNQTLGLQAETILPEFFDGAVPANGASFLYDAVIATGMAACDKVSIQAVGFQGASGKFILKDRSLDADGVTFAVFEVQSSFGEEEAIPEIPTFEAILLDMTKNGIWGNVTPAESQETSDSPKQSHAAVIVTLVLASTALVFSLGSCFFVFYFRNNRIVAVGQPPFIGMICFGSVLVSFSMYFTAVLTSGQSQQLFDAACVASTWMLYIGQITVYMALFSKLWRVAKVSQFRRGQKILMKHVMGPFLAMIVGAIAVLVVWTIVDPPHWDSDVFDESWVQDGEFGICNKDQVFAIVMAVLITVAVVIALWMSCKTRELPEDISDSRRVCQTLTAQLILSLAGCILMVLSSTLENDTLLFASSVVLDFLFSVTSVAFLVIPKMYYVRRHQLTGELPPGLRRGGTQISGINAGPNTIGDGGSSTLSRHRHSLSVQPERSSTVELTLMASIRNFFTNMGRRESQKSLPRSSTKSIQQPNTSSHRPQASLDTRGSSHSIQRRAANDGEVATTNPTPNASGAAAVSRGSRDNQSTLPIRTISLVTQPASISTLPSDSACTSPPGSRSSLNVPADDVTDLAINTENDV